MQVETREHSGKNYKVVNGTWYHAQTPDQIIEILENARQTGTTLRVHYGDIATGKDWLDEYDVRGLIGRSMGPVKIPLLIKRRDSIGGGGLLEHCIVKIRSTNLRNSTVLYEHPEYHAGRFDIQPCTDIEGYISEVLVDGSVQARFRKVGQAERWVRKMVG